MARFKIEDFPESVQRQIRAQIAETQNSGVRSQEPEFKKPESSTSGTRHKEPNKTESDYRAIHLRGMDARYEALTFRMANGHRYTPDWVIFSDGKPVACHECKGGYALQSQQRARLAFDQARVEFLWLTWVWAVKTNEGWKVED